MRIKLISLTVLFMALTCNIFAETKKMVQSQLTEATVFFRGAELTHTATVSLEKGDNELVLTGLSSVVDANSIKIKTTNGVLVSAYEFSVDYLYNKQAKGDSLGVKKLQTDITAYKSQIAEIETIIRVNIEVLDVLRKSVIKNVEGSENGLSITDLIKTMDYYKSKSLELETQLRADMVKKEELNQQLDRLTAQLEKDLRVNDKVSGMLKLNLVSPSVNNSKLIITYYTSAAGWVPHHDINVASINTPITISTKAKVRQTTGFDWDKVKLSLSTSLPQSNKVAPLFQAWFLRFYEPIQISKKQMNRDDMMQNAYSYKLEDVAESSIVMEEEIVEQPKMDNYVMVSENQLNITYNIDIPYSIPATGKEQNIELKTQETQAQFKYYAAPKLDVETFVLAEIADWQKLNLLNGRANVTYDGTYVGETFIDASSISENLTLTLGADKRVSVKREKLQDYSSTKFLGSDTKQTFNYQLTVRNNQNIAVKMVLKDQYPKSTTKEIEVELLKETTKPSFNIEDLGVVTWEFDLKPGEVKTFNLVYSVKYPKGKTINL